MLRTLAMDEAEKNLKWQELLCREKKARDWVYRLRLEGASKAEIRQPLQTWWLTVSDVLRLYRLGLISGEAPAPPLEVLDLLSQHTAYLAVGKIPLPIADAASEGRPRHRKCTILELPWRTCWRP
jgi:hypothetical protein